jgi:hypothetical protein
MAHCEAGVTLRAEIEEAIFYHDHFSHLLVPFNTSDFLQDVKPVCRSLFDTGLLLQRFVPIVHPPPPELEGFSTPTTAARLHASFGADSPQALQTELQEAVTLVNACPRHAPSPAAVAAVRRCSARVRALPLPPAALSAASLYLEARVAETVHEKLRLYWLCYLTLLQLGESTHEFFRGRELLSLSGLSGEANHWLCRSPVNPLGMLVVEDIYQLVPLSLELDSRFALVMATLRLTIDFLLNLHNVMVCS